MSTPFQNRLVGTIIVAAVAIIFLPDLLDGEKKSYQDQFSDIPEQPKVSFRKQEFSFPQEKLTPIIDEKIHDDIALDDEANQINTNSQDAKAIDLDEKSSSNVAISSTDTTTNIAAKSSTKSVKPQDKDSMTSVDPVLPEKAVKQQAWVIQLGSFRHQQNVDDLLKRLKNKGYTCFTKPIKTKNGNLVKVFVGPELIKSSLEKKLPDLKALTKVDGKITRFYPTE